VEEIFGDQREIRDKETVQPENFLRGKHGHVRQDEELDDVRPRHLRIDKSVAAVRGTAFLKRALTFYSTSNFQR
jgi:hypothetical protein